MYQNERLFKSKAYLVTQNSPEIFNLFNVLDKRLHRVKRRIIGEGISEKSMRKFEPDMTEEINIFLLQLVKSSSNHSKAVDMTKACQYLGFDIIGRLGFGTALALQTDEKNRFMSKGLETSNYRSNIYMQFPLLKKIGMEVLLYPFILTRQMKYYAALKDIIVARRAEGKDAKRDLYSFVADIKDPERERGCD
jgi:cytochrome P450